MIPVEFACRTCQEEKFPESGCPHCTPDFAEVSVSYCSLVRGEYLALIEEYWF